MSNKPIESEISSYVGKLLRDNFGKGPSSVYVSIKKPFITIHVRDFLAPMEKILVNQSEQERVEQTRDMLMRELLPEMKATINVTADIHLQEMYYDWSLSNRSGIIIGVMHQEDHVSHTDEYEEKAGVHEEINHVSKQAEKAPEKIESFYINDRTLLIIRNGILVPIEKELIRSGFEQKLKLVKRHLEKRLINTASFEQILGLPVGDAFVDWDFNQDLSYVVLILKPNQK